MMDINYRLAICTILYIGTIVATDIPTTPHSPINGSCDIGEYLDKKSGNCCKMCPPGAFAKVRCTSDNNTECANCPPGTFTSIPNYSNGCHQCRGHCPEGAFDEKRCTTTHDRICKCLPGWFCVTGSASLQCPMCIPKRKCPCGYFGGIDELGNPLCKSCCKGEYCEHIRSYRPGYVPCNLSKCN
ncbi:tnf receptor [Volepox virus]|uniref:Tnf receptor n=1 Tax=Volepox virus TaxID=28874 RepID=A0A1C9KCH4_9POXV|nr:tnf receptor [Volepox virus]AOP31865.1 tnf receptor [Volepox virus]